MRELTDRQFIKLIFRASGISFAFFMLFLFGGDVLFDKVFLIEFDSFRIFGGIVIFSFAYYYIVQGKKSLLQVKEDLNDLASDIALPFMVGAGSISITILIAHNYSKLEGVFMILGGLLLAIAVILILKVIKEHIILKEFRVAFDKAMEILLRLNGFFVGAIGIDMILTGINNLFFQK
jgi:multiple antibiotic resistance protein